MNLILHEKGRRNIKVKQCTTDIYNGVYSKHTIWVLTDDSSCEYGDIVRLQDMPELHGEHEVIYSMFT